MTNLRISSAKGEKVLLLTSTAHKAIFHKDIDGEKFPLIARLSEFRRSGEIPVFFLSDFISELREMAETRQGEGIALGALNSLTCLAESSAAVNQAVVFRPEAEG
jgi:hypothetical protein